MQLHWYNLRTGACYGGCYVSSWHIYLLLSYVPPLGAGEGWILTSYRGP